MQHRLTAATLTACFLTVAGCSTANQQRSAAQPPADHLFTSQASAPLWGASATVGRVVAEQSAAARIFELVGIDYCCGGDTSLSDAAAAAGLSLDRLLGALSVVGPGHFEQGHRDWREASVDELIDHIVDHYHAELRRDLPRLDQLIATVTNVHGALHPELAQVQTTFLSLKAEMLRHLELEEQSVFPAIRQLSRGTPPDDVQSLMQHMMDDHDEAGEALETIRRLTGEYTPPAEACSLYRQMLQSLERFERQTFSHIHLENNVLVPRAQTLLMQYTR